MQNNTTKPKKKFYKKWWFWLLVVFVIFGVGSQMSDNDNSDKGHTAQTDGTNKYTKEHKPENDVPKEYESALKSAKTYSSMMHMSKLGIKEQLTSEYGDKFSEEAANYAVENLNVDYNKNALKKAESYQDDMSMSPEAIREQLTSDYGEKFTAEEADYAMQHLSK